MFGIAKGFGLENILESWLRERFSEQQDVLTYLLQFSQTTLQEAKGGLIAGVGVFCLLFTAIRLIASVESTMNEMWGIRQGRSWVRKFGDYLALLLTCPILLAISSSVTIFVTTKVSIITNAIPLLSSAQSAVETVLSIVPFVTSAMLFSLLLYSLPCAPVRLLPACLAGSIIAVVFQWVQSCYIIFQLRLTKVSAIYGSFVALPLFLVWLWMSWLMLLIAAELLVFFQEKGWKTTVTSFTDSSLEKLEVETAVLAKTISKFQAGSPISTSDLHKNVDAPLRSISDAINRLHDRGLIHAVSSRSYTATVVPSQTAFSTSLADLALPFVPRAQRTLAPIAQKIDASVASWTQELRNNPLNVTVEKLSKDT
jgi:membrane protein